MIHIYYFTAKMTYKYIRNIYNHMITSKTEQFITKAKHIHGNKYDYSKVNYINAKTKVIISCR